MDAERLIAISDVHLDSWREENPEACADKTAAFVEFLRWVREDSGAGHLAIVGDLFDVPQIGHAPLLPTHDGVLGQLAEITRAGISIHYVVGNHDAGLMALNLEGHPGFELAYPGLTIRCGGLLVRLEHGHLMDAWLWAFFHHKGTQVPPATPRDAMAHFLSGCQAQVPAPPGMVFVHDTMYEALQWRPMETGFTPAEKRLGITVMSQHLGDGFADVAAAGELPVEHEEILAAVAEAGLTVEQLKGSEPLPEGALELFWPIGRRYYSILPWRRAARCRMRALRAETPELDALIMGHVHAADEFRWQENGREAVYANCGSWRWDNGSFVIVDQAEVRAIKRKWRDPLPSL